MASSIILSVKDLAKKVLPEELTLKIHRILQARRDRRAPQSPVLLIKGPYLPRWICGSFQPEDQSQASLVGLAGDLALASDKKLQELVWPLQIHGEGNALEVSHFAANSPDILLDLLLDRLRSLRPQAAVLVDLEDPATLVFARACRILGISRVYVPPRTLRIAVNPAPTDPPIPQVFDVALVWSEQQRRTLLDQGLKGAALLPSQRPDFATPQPVSEKRSILVWLSRDDLWQSAKGLEQFGHNFVDLAEAVGKQIDFLFDDAMQDRIPQSLYEHILLSANCSLRLAPHPSDSLGLLLHNVDAVIVDSARNAIQAANAGVPHVDLRAFLNDQHRVGQGNLAMKAISNDVLSHFDAGAAAVDETPLPATEHAESCVDLLKRLTDQPVAPPASVFGDILAGRAPVVTKAVATFEASSFEKDKRFMLALVGATRIELVDQTTPLIDMIDADVFLKSGLHSTAHKRTLELAHSRLHAEMLTLEDGFVCSVGSGFEGSPKCAIIMDDLGVFYDATRPSRLEKLLSSDMELDAQQTRRARDAIALLTETKVTKYNFAPYKPMPPSAPGRKTVLVVDQRASDPSIEAGFASQSTFDTMLAEALSLSDDHDIWIKTHPDATLSVAALKAAAKRPNVTLITDDRNPYSFVDRADKVFVVTSDMGFEALLAGKEVHCFGMPFYAGWGLTHDRAGVARRTRERSLEDVFHTFCITLSRYVDPNTGQRCQFEDLVKRIAEIRPWTLDPSDVPDPSQAAKASGDPPRRAVENDLCPKIQSLDAFLAEPHTLLGLNMAGWKQAYFRRLLPQHQIKFLPGPAHLLNIAPAALKVKNPAFLVWGRYTVPGLESFAKDHGLRIIRTEDGFLRSVGLGANYILPYSVCLDGSGIYFDATQPSDLETILQTYDFDGSSDLMSEAAQCRKLIVEHGLSKYNFAYPILDEPYGPKTGRRVLVIGQVEDDASIRFGAPPGSTNNALVRLAHRENPDAQIIYKIHPDVASGRRAYRSDPQEVASICQVHAAPLTLQNSFQGVDQVYTLTSLAGFEALIRDIPVTVVGMPFYAGWGLTDDRSTCDRRTRRLTRDQLFAGAYLLYARYADPESGHPMKLEDVVHRIRTELETQFNSPEADTAAENLQAVPALKP